MVYIILGNGFEPIEAIAPCDILRRGGVDVKFAGIGGTLIAGGHGISVEADCTVEEIDENALEMVVLPGGLGGVESILGCQAALDVISRAAKAGKFVAAICAGPMVLAKLGLVAGKTVTCYPGCEAQLPGANYAPAAAQQDGTIITGEGPGSSLTFGFRLLAALKGEAAAESVASAMVVCG